MTNRRDVIKGSMAATAFLGTGSAIAAGGRGAAPPGPPEPVPPLHAIIFEQESAAGRAFGAAARRSGVPVHGISGDVTGLWYKELDPMWRRQPAAVAGLTGPGVLFVLERLAWEKGMAVLYRGTHKANGRGALEHRMAGPGAMLGGTAKLGPDWAAEMAALMPRCPAAGTNPARLTVTTQPEDLGEDGLVSWVIAPTERTAFPRT